MERHLKFSSIDGAIDPKVYSYKHKFNPLEVPLMDILAVDTQRDFEWQFPSRETMMSLQANRGLARSMLRVCEVREIILNGNHSEDEQREIIDWHHQQLARDQEDMPGAPLSLDVEEIHCTLMDDLHLTGQRPHQGDRVRLHDKPGREYHGQHLDRHIQFPCRLMCGNGVTWAVMVTTLTNPRSEDKRVTHSVKKFVVPENILKLLEGLPLSIGFGIKGVYTAQSCEN